MGKRLVKFKCNMCCRNVHHWKENLSQMQELLNDETIDFPFKESNGVCEMLQDNMCSIYESRPIVCNTEKMYALQHKTTGMSVTEFLRLQAISCAKNQLGLR